MLDQLWAVSPYEIPAAASPPRSGMAAPVERQDVGAPGAVETSQQTTEANNGNN